MTLTQRAEAYRRARKVLTRSWDDWLVIGAALLQARETALDEARTDQPAGSRYNRKLDAILKRERLDRMDRAARRHLLGVMDNLPAIEAWRQTLTRSQRIRLNQSDPAAVLRNWRKATQPPRAAEPAGVRKAERDAVLKANAPPQEELEPSAPSRKSLLGQELEQKLTAANAAIERLTRLLDAERRLRAPVMKRRRRRRLSHPAAGVA